jgi:hypothetical protein
MWMILLIISSNISVHDHTTDFVGPFVDEKSCEVVAERIERITPAGYNAEANCFYKGD